MKNKILIRSNNNKMRFFISGVLFLGVINFWLSTKSCNKPFKEELTINEKEKIIFNQKKKTITKVTRSNSGKMEKKIIKGVRGIEISVPNIKGDVTITPRTRGYIWEPGLSLFYSKNKVNLGLDLQWLYWGQYGINTGFGISTSYKYSTYFGISYNFYSNSYFIVGVNDNLKPIIGFKISF